MDEKEGGLMREEEELGGLVVVCEADLVSERSEGEEFEESMIGITFFES
jgi:hypothetical protein